MTFLDNIERKYLFNFTRFLALFFIIIALLAISLGISTLMKNTFHDSIKIDSDEISYIVKPKDNIESDATIQSAINDPLRDKKLTFAVQKHFSDPENMLVLKNWLLPLSEKEVDDFLQELEEVITAAEAENTDVPDAVNRFAQLKQEKFLVREQKNSINQAQRYAYAIGSGVSIMIIALFSIVLVMLAIERNTRK